MKKKLLTLMMVATMGMTVLAGCGDGEGKDNKSESNKATNLSVTLDGVNVEIGADGDKVIDKLGEPNSSFTNTSCAFGDEETISIYDGYQITVSSVNKKNIVTAIEFTDDSKATADGTRIGTEAKAATDNEKVDVKDNGATVVESGKSKLTIVTKDGVVTGISYGYVE